MKFYTSFFTRGDKIITRGYDNGKRFTHKVPYKPTLYVPINRPSKWQTHLGEFVEPVHFDSIKDAKDFVQTYKDVDNFKIYGMQQFAYVHIFEEYTKDYDSSLIKILNIDIEVQSDDGFPAPGDALYPIISIAASVTHRGQRNYFAFGTQDYIGTLQANTRYMKCDSEYDLLKSLMAFLTHVDADIYTGWNIETFDIPYLYNRVGKVVSKECADMISPVGQVYAKEKTGRFGEEVSIYTVHGVTVMDYLPLYKKFTYTQRESYTLGYISQIELGKTKIEYEEEQTLRQLYKSNYTKFIDYNIRDVELVDGLEDKLKLIEMVFAIAYDAQVNYEDAFSQVRMWDVLIHNYLMKSNIVIPPKNDDTHKSSSFTGAYVKDPQIGMWDWILGFDLDGLYPHLIMQYNISPETLTNEYIDVNIDSVIARTQNFKNSENAVAANGHTFSRIKQGFLPAMMETMYNERKLYKGKMIEAQAELEKVELRLKEML